jgi:hypothetical protein
MSSELVYEVSKAMAKNQSWLSGKWSDLLPIVENVPGKRWSMRQRYGSRCGIGPQPIPPHAFSLALHFFLLLRPVHQPFALPLATTDSSS